MFACEHEASPPTSCAWARASPAATCPLAATLATERIYEGFLDELTKSRHSSTGTYSTCWPAPRALATLDVFEEERTLERLQPKLELLGRLLEPVAAHPEVAEVRRRGTMTGIQLRHHPPELRMGHRVTLEARRRGAIVRPLGDAGGSQGRPWPSPRPSSPRSSPPPSSRSKAATAEWRWRPWPDPLRPPRTGHNHMAQNIFPALRYADARAAVEFLRTPPGSRSLPSCRTRTARSPTASSSSRVAW